MQGVRRLFRRARSDLDRGPRRPAAAPGARSSAVGRVPGRPLRDPAIGSFDSRLPGWRVGARIKKWKTQPSTSSQGRRHVAGNVARTQNSSAPYLILPRVEIFVCTNASAAASVGPRPRRKVAQVGKALIRVSLTAAYPPSAASWVRANLYGPVVPPPSRRRTPPPDDPATLLHLIACRMGGGSSTAPRSRPSK